MGAGAGRERFIAIVIGERWPSAPAAMGMPVYTVTSWILRIFQNSPSPRLADVFFPSLFPIYLNLNIHASFHPLAASANGIILRAA